MPRWERAIEMGGVGVCVRGSVEGVDGDDDYSHLIHLGMMVGAVSGL